jgi:hypothetical protein
MKDPCPPGTLLEHTHYNGATMQGQFVATTIALRNGEPTPAFIVLLSTGQYDYWFVSPNVRKVEDLTPSDAPDSVHAGVNLSLLTGDPELTDYQRGGRDALTALADEFKLYHAGIGEHATMRANAVRIANQLVKDNLIDGTQHAKLLNGFTFPTSSQWYVDTALLRAESLPHDPKE